jgi:hypothetical protein
MFYEYGNIGEKETVICVNVVSRLSVGIIHLFLSFFNDVF